MTIHICPGPTVRTLANRIVVKWCFGCRDHLLHRGVLLTDADPSYEPVLVWECYGCGHDLTRFGDGWRSPVALQERVVGGG